MMRKLLFTLVLTLGTTAAVYAGGLMTNTNYHIAFDRMFARGATTEIDAAFSNPAGLAWGYEGFQLSLNFQKPWQNRDIHTNIPGYLGAGFDKTYNGKASAPIVPALFATYKKGNWAFSSMIGIVGSGGFVEYDEGIPMFEVPIRAMLASKGVMPTDYAYIANMKGKQYIYGGQLNITRKINDNFSAAFGIRANYYDGYNRGFVEAVSPASVGPVDYINLHLDCIQRGWGFTPLFSFAYHDEHLTISARYELRTKINTKNDTQELSIYMAGQEKPTDVKALAEQLGNEKTIAALSQAVGEDMAGKVKPYLPDESIRYDMPSLLTIAVGYHFTPQLRAALEYHFFDDKHAKMYGDRQKELTHGTHEFLAGVEYDINDKFTVSCGGQRTDYGLSDGYQQNTSFACDSYSLGLGGAWNITDKMRLNVSYFCSLYSDYDKTQTNYQGTPYTGTDTYSRTNHVIGIGLDYKF
jgi:long-chain fatty acid transport protein